MEGNYRVIAIENEDHGAAFGTWNTNDGHAVPALTPAQVRSNAAILKWAHVTHGVPLQLCPDSRPGSKGLAYHRQGIDGNFDSYAYPGRVSGGEVWTNYSGKVCPGDKRISQRNEILTLAKGLGDELTMAQYDEIMNALASIKALVVRQDQRTLRILQHLIPPGLDPDSNLDIWTYIKKIDEHGGGLIPDPERPGRNIWKAHREHEAGS